MKYQVENNIENTRIDNYLMPLTGLSRTKIASLIKNNKITVNENSTKASYTVKENDIIEIEFEEINNELIPEKMDLNIIYEDDDVIVVDKDNGVVVHPAAGNTEHTLVNGLIYHSKNLSTTNGEFRPGIVHRIDAYTTGLLMIAKNDRAHEILAKQLEQKTTHRVYYALVWGVINNNTGTIDAPIGRDINSRKKMAVTDINSKNAITHFKVLERYPETTLIELKLETGRTHQIRVHMNYIGYPIVNDPVYGNKKLFDKTGQCLHAKEIGFVHPTTNKYIEFKSDLPECFINIQNQLK